jgi:hypothetical protein
MDEEGANSLSRRDAMAWLGSGAAMIAASAAMGQAGTQSSPPSGTATLENRLSKHPQPLFVNRPNPGRAWRRIWIQSLTTAGRLSGSGRLMARKARRVELLADLKTATAGLEKSFDQEVL